MSISNVAKYQLKEILSTIVFFSIITLILLVINERNDFPLLRSLIAVVFISLSVSFYELYLVKKLRNYVRTHLLILISVAYYFLIFAIMLFAAIYIHLVFKEHLEFSEAIGTNVLKLAPKDIYNSLFFLFVFLAVRFLMNQLKARTIKGITKKIFFGKAGLPIKDTRIFMFMDLKSSTSYAEKLGYLKYSQFIKDIYREIDEYVIETRGIIYQYVGDEIVIVWDLKDGLRNNNCLRFFDLFEKRIHELKNYFFHEYEIIPEFKAAFHYGEVAIAEIGNVLRRDIAFHGDTVNTTARICSKCRELEEKILISETLVEKLSQKNNNHKFESVGRYNLKGKREEVELFKTAYST